MEVHDTRDWKIEFSNIHRIYLELNYTMRVKGGSIFVITGKGETEDKMIRSIIMDRIRVIAGEIINRELTADVIAAETGVHKEVIERIISLDENLAGELRADELIVLCDYFDIKLI